MRTAPPSEIRLVHFGLWRAGLGALVLVASVALGAWWWPMPAGASAWPIAALAASAVLAAAWGTRRIAPAHLRDGPGGWVVMDPSGAASGPYRLDVVVDLGVWMLWRMRPAPAVRRARTIWIPAQRRGHEAHWAAMRRAVYFPRPTVGGPPGAEPHRPE